MATDYTRIIDSRHPNFLNLSTEWDKWRLTYLGGDEFRDRYLENFSNREDDNDFKLRKSITPIPGFAKSAINDIRNSIFQRLGDVVREGGSTSFQKALAGEDGGVDLRGSTMNYFLGNHCLTDLLVMGKVGVYVDAPEAGPQTTMAESSRIRPYLYSYRVEDILNFSCSNPEAPSEFQSILLRDTVMKYDSVTWLPLQFIHRYRMVWINQETGKVNIQFFDEKGNEVDREGNPGGPIELQIERIPFVLMDIGDSLIKDVCQHQIALLNLGSSDVNYALRSNFPFYVEQRDMRAVGSHLKLAGGDGSATTGGQGADDDDIKVGTTHGRYYDRDTDQPAFIAPPSEPLEASLKLQEKLEQDVRKLVNLAVVNLATRSSAESKSMDNQGLEAGLSFIGLVLEAGERRIADYWASYEEKTRSRRQVALIKYPDRYSLKTDSDRIEEAGKLAELINSLPSRKAKREVSKMMALSLLGSRVKVDKMQTIFKEIDEAPYTTSDPDIIEMAVDKGLCGNKTASIALGFEDDEHEQAAEDHLERIKRIAETQGITDGGTDPASRGVDDLSPDPNNAGREEKELSRSTDMNDTTRSRVRGAGRNTQEE